MQDGLSGTVTGVEWVGRSLEQMDLDDMLKELRRVEGRIMFVLQ